VKRILITENQKSRLINAILSESSDYAIIVKEIVDFVDLNYRTDIGTYRKGGEYFEKPIIIVNVDDEMITPKDLLLYLGYKFKLINKDLLKQIMLDWINGDIRDYNLTKNISLM
jgi:hypothetical protein